MNRLILGVLPCVLAACSTPSAVTTAPTPAPASTAQAPVPALSYEVILTKLESPWDMAFLPDGTMFFTEKCHGLSVRQPGGAVVKLVGMKDVKGYSANANDLFCEGQAGMMGVAVDPNFASNRFIYVYSTSSMTAPGTNRVMRLKVNDNATGVTSRVDIVTDIPYKPRASDHPFGGPGAHNGGRLRFSPGDGYLYVTTGDTHNGEVPQSPTRIGGKVLRIDRDGKAAPGNGAPAGFDPRIYTYGHRNPQGITFRPGTNQPYVAENGPWHTDEVTALVAGGNSGWDPRPNIGGRSACPDNYCGYSPNQMGAVDPKIRSGFMPMTDTKTYPNAMKPAWTNDGLSQGLFAGTFLTGSRWKSWDGRMIIGFAGIGIHGTPVGNRLDVLNIKADGLSATRTTVNLPMPAARFRSLVQGPDGNLYVATDEGAISRLTPS
ncbi:PQQ-dependent sugar dehydrogenase [Variovorax saccharolyticus]|uniref:PQQ-dependent sugar dehydrogenase n=1 Tax=Variovorax saccharolyticus TaxID=3053516 RepID=UPI0025762F67|nr:PQQ-dependent sugar dehydrogenase [Variovorax sp. J22R187]MDM0022838.1 PQQ-dependent sugar dehydrogenase [Variovorax sp. J22R187]